MLSVLRAAAAGARLVSSLERPEIGDEQVHGSEADQIRLGARAGVGRCAADLEAVPQFP